MSLQCPAAVTEGEAGGTGRKGVGPAASPRPCKARAPATCRQRAGGCRRGRPVVTALGGCAFAWRVGEATCSPDLLHLESNSSPKTTNGDTAAPSPGSQARPGSCTPWALAMPISLPSLLHFLAGASVLTQGGPRARLACHRHVPRRATRPRTERARDLCSGPRGRACALLACTREGVPHPLWGQISGLQRGLKNVLDQLCVPVTRLTSSSACFRKGPGWPRPPGNDRNVPSYAVPCHLLDGVSEPLSHPRGPRSPTAATPPKPDQQEVTERGLRRPGRNGGALETGIPQTTAQPGPFRATRLDFHAWSADSEKRLLSPSGAISGLARLGPRRETPLRPWPPSPCAWARRSHVRAAHGCSTGRATYFQRGRDRESMPDAVLTVDEALRT